MSDTTESDRVCRNCRFWNSETSNWGRCHRYPPQFWSEGEACGAAFVGTDGHDWCGEHQPNIYPCLENMITAGYIIEDPHKPLKTGA